MCQHCRARRFCVLWREERERQGEGTSGDGKEPAAQGAHAPGRLSLQVCTRLVLHHSKRDGTGEPSRPFASACARSDTCVHRHTCAPAKVSTRKASRHVAGSCLQASACGCAYMQARERERRIWRDGYGQGEGDGYEKERERRIWRGRRRGGGGGGGEGEGEGEFFETRRSATRSRWLSATMSPAPARSISYQ